MKSEDGNYNFHDYTAGLVDSQECLSFDTNKRIIQSVSHGRSKMYVCGVFKYDACFFKGNV